jgi:hypothetical protein
VKLALLVALLAAPACAHVQKDQTVCPEYRNIRCVGEARCSMDKQRGCKVCQCEDMDMDSPPVGTSPDDQTRPPESDH